MKPTKGDIAKPVSELEEAVANLQYFKEMSFAYNLSIKRMQNDHKICMKEISKWEQRLEQIRAKKGRGA